ncbi:MAG: acetyl-CoA carboxylase biotin carboxyl carrier protein subunit [bacterium]
MEKLNIDATLYETNLTEKYKNRKRYAVPNPKIIYTTIPGTINELFVKPGQKVKKGDLILILEAMKMRNHILSPMDGTIKCLFVEVNEMVSKGKELIKFE